MSIQAGGTLVRGADVIADSPHTVGCVVVGIEPGAPSWALLRAAADEAARRDAVLAVVTVLPPPEASPHAPDGDRGDQNRESELLPYVESLLPDHPTSTIVLSQLRHDEVEANREPLASAALLIVGASSASGVQAFGPETVSWRLLRAARCPVLVVPERADGLTSPSSDRPVVLAGLSGRQSDPAVIFNAYSEARRRGGDVQLLHAYTPGHGETYDQGLQRAMLVVTRATRRVGPPRDIGTSVILSQDRPTTALLRQADHASVLVLAARSGSMAGLITASVSRPVLATSPCPVLTVPWLLMDQKPNRQALLDTGL